MKLTPFLYDNDDGGSGGAANDDAAKGGDGGATDGKTDGAQAGKDGGTGGEGGKAPLAGSTKGEPGSEAPLATKKGDNGADDGGGSKDQDGTGGAPEKYDDFNFPEGFALEGGELDSAVEAFKKAGLSQESAQLMIDTHAKVLQSSIDRQNAALVNQWGQQLREDKEFGGANYEANKERVNNFIDKLLTPEERSEIEPLFLSPWGYHRVMFALLHRAATKIGEDSFVGKSGAGKQDLSAAEKLYSKVDLVENQAAQR